MERNGAPGNDVEDRVGTLKERDAGRRDGKESSGWLLEMGCSRNDERRIRRKGLSKENC